MYKLIYYLPPLASLCTCFIYRMTTGVMIIYWRTWTHSNEGWLIGNKEKEISVNSMIGFIYSSYGANLGIINSYD